MLDQFSLENKTALVTGCKRGIGKAVATALAGAGADIIGVSETLEESGSEIEAAVGAVGRKFAAYQCDFSDRDRLYGFVEQVNANHSVVDILINNAGTIAAMIQRT